MSQPTNSLITEAMEVVKSMPGSERILEDLKDGKINPLEATKKLMLMALKEGKMQSLATSYNKVKKSVESEDTRIWMDHSNGKRILNPIIHASLTERAFLDGDVPEYRFGPIPEGGKPAVPVATTSLNSVVIGMQVEEASNEVGKLIQISEKSHWKALEEKTSKERSLLPTQKVSSPTGIKGYETGKLPVLRKTKHIKISELVGLNEEVKSAHVFTVLATTQGRVSGSHALKKNLEKYLRKKGFEVSKSTLPEVAVFDWSTQCFGKESVSPDWDPVTNAFSKMCAGLIEVCKKGVPTSVEVVPISGIADRTFGWKLMVGAEE